MEGDFGGWKSKRVVLSSESSLPLPSWSFDGGEEAIEMVGPRDFQALSGDLVLWTRLSPLVFNLTGSLDHHQTLPSLSLSDMSMQLFFGSRLLATEPVPQPITTSWEKVRKKTK